jgi:hypothetical protein
MAPYLFWVYAIIGSVVAFEVVRRAARSDRAHSNVVTELDVAGYFCMFLVSAGLWPGLLICVGVSKLMNQWRKK